METIEPTYVIEIGRDLPDRENFADWLKAKGHIIDRATSTITYVDGESIQRNLEARNIFINLLGEYKKENP